MKFFIHLVVDPWPSPIDGGCRLSNEQPGRLPALGRKYDGLCGHIVFGHEKKSRQVASSRETCQ